MAYSKLDILGYRGFGKLQTLNLALPNGKLGSGLTIIVGPNNSGKSTIVEAFKAVSQYQPPSFTEGRRNKKAGDKVEIKIYNHNDNSYVIMKTLPSGGSETEYIAYGNENARKRIMTLPSRRTFTPYFGKGSPYSREHYINNSQLPAVRGNQLQNFENRLFNIQKDKVQFQRFNDVLRKVLNFIPEWHIDQSDNGNYYVKFNFCGLSHNSDGAGEGLLSVFTIVDALYDSEEGDTIVVDEPELSLHPALLRKLSDLIVEFSATRQIIVSTHSPYFIDWQSLLAGGKIARTIKDSDGDIRIFQLQEETIRDISGLLDNFNNPHILGLDAKEVFFLDESIILVEGQEDVVFIKKIVELLKLQLQGTFYGWGAGGASNISKILKIIQDLGFEKCTVILDNNMFDTLLELENDYPRYKILSIPTNDVRDKKEVKPKLAIEGLIDYGGTTINPKHQETIREMIAQINDYFRSSDEKSI